MSDGSQQLPDHRIQEMMQAQRELAEQNRQLRQTVESLTTRLRGPDPAEDSPFAPEVERALQGRISQALTQQANQFKQQFGYIWDKQDRLDFQQRYGAEALKTYGDKIEDLRKKAQQEGRYLNHEDAFKFVKFEETNRKPQENPAPPMSEPKFDPYLGKYVQPEQTPQQAAPQVPQVPQGAPAPQVPQVPQVPQAPVQTGISPTEFGLPPVGPTNTGVASAPQGQGTGQINLDTATEEQVDAWASRYGDIPL